jgi:hypothetical protein
MTDTRELNLRLCALFPSVIPRGMTLGSSERDTLFELKEFNGLRWPEVPLKVLTQKFDAPSFFSPLAFHYYIPSYISHSLVSLNEMDLCLDAVFRVFRYRDDSARMIWREERLMLFSSRQWQLVKQWMEWVEEHKQAEDMPSLGDALSAVREVNR